MTSSVSGQDEPNLALCVTGYSSGQAGWSYLSVHKHAKKELGQYPAILTEPAWSITHMYHVKQFCFHSVLIAYFFCAFVLDSLDSHKRKWGDSDFLIYPWFSLDSYRNHYAKSGDQAIKR